MLPVKYSYVKSEKVKTRHPSQFANIPCKHSLSATFFSSWKKNRMDNVGIAFSSRCGSVGIGWFFTVVDFPESLKCTLSYAHTNTTLLSIFTSKGYHKMRFKLFKGTACSTRAGLASFLVGKGMKNQLQCSSASYKLSKLIGKRRA